MTAKIMHRKTALWKILVPAIVLCFLIAAPAAAQEQEQQGQEQQGQEKQEYEYQEPEKKAEDFSEGDLEKFAEAQSEVETIRNEYSDELSGVEDTEKARELQDKYAQQMVDAIKEIGLDVQTYNEVSMAIQNDPDLKEKVEGMAN
ncbi:MAG: DUF4168 domain-containing protein [Desulfobacterales bacterium]